MTNNLLIFFPFFVSLMTPDDFPSPLIIFKIPILYILQFKIYRKLNFLETRAFFLPKTMPQKYNKMPLIFHNFSSNWGFTVKFLYWLSSFIHSSAQRKKKKERGFLFFLNVNYWHNCRYLCQNKAAFNRSLLNFKSSEQWI